MAATESSLSTSDSFVGERVARFRFSAAKCANARHHSDETSGGSRTHYERITTISGGHLSETARASDEVILPALTAYARFGSHARVLRPWTLGETETRPA
eukprot:5786868-Pleurochrysis_carterae.AAC.1